MCLFARELAGLFLCLLACLADDVCLLSFFVENVLGSVDNEITPFPHLSSSRRPLEDLNKTKVTSSLLRFLRVIFFWFQGTLQQFLANTKCILCVSALEILGMIWNGFVSPGPLSNSEDINTKILCEQHIKGIEHTQVAWCHSCARGVTLLSSYLTTTRQIKIRTHIPD